MTNSWQNKNRKKIMQFSIKRQFPGSILQLHPDFTLVAAGEALSPDKGIPVKHSHRGRS